MKTSKKARIIGIIIIVALVVIFLLWYTRPQTIDSVLELDAEDIESISVISTITQPLDDVSVSMGPSRSIRIHEADVDAILEHLRSTRYRFDLRSLTFPDSFHRKDVPGNIMLTINYVDGSWDLIECSYKIVFGLNNGSPGLVIAEATDGEFLGRLSSYIIEVGAKD